MSPNQFAAAAATYANVAAERVAAEVSTLVTVAPSPRRGCPILAAVGVTRGTFSEPETIAIATAIYAAADPRGPARTADQMSEHARRLLIAAGRWDSADQRPFISSGLTWGPGSLSKLFFATAFNAEMVRATAERLITLAAMQAGIERRAA